MSIQIWFRGDNLLILIIVLFADLLVLWGFFFSANLISLFVLCCFICWARLLIYFLKNNFFLEKNKIYTEISLHFMGINISLGKKKYKHHIIILKC